MREHCKKGNRRTKFEFSRIKNNLENRTLRYGKKNFFLFSSFPKWGLHTDNIVLWFKKGIKLLIQGINFKMGKKINVQNIDYKGVNFHPSHQFNPTWFFA